MLESATFMAKLCDMSNSIEIGSVDKMNKLGKAKKNNNCYLTDFDYFR